MRNYGQRAREAAVRVGARLRYYRELRGLTCTALGRLAYDNGIGISGPQISKMERGAHLRQPPFVWDGLAEILGTTTAALLDAGTPPRPIPLEWLVRDRELCANLETLAASFGADRLTEFLRQQVHYIGKINGLLGRSGDGPGGSSPGRRRLSVVK